MKKYQALNVVVRMEPTLKYSFNVRSFFTDQETRDIGLGIVLWRGYFQSVRPAPGRMLVNIDISTGTMYKPGPLIALAAEALGERGGSQQAIVQRLSPPNGLDDRSRVRLQRFLSGIRVVVNPIGGQQQGQTRRTPRVVKKISDRGASSLTFKLREGGQMTVAGYFKKTYNRELLYPSLFCVEVSPSLLLNLPCAEPSPGR